MDIAYNTTKKHLFHSIVAIFPKSIFFLLIVVASMLQGCASDPVLDQRELAVAYPPQVAASEYDEVGISHDTVSTGQAQDKSGQAEKEPAEKPGSASVAIEDQDKTVKASQKHTQKRTQKKPANKPTQERAAKSESKQSKPVVTKAPASENKAPNVSKKRQEKSSSTQNAGKLSPADKARIAGNKRLSQAETQIAMISENEKPKSPGYPEIRDLSMLPIKLDANWKLDRMASVGCELSFQQRVMEDGQGPTKIDWVLNGSGMEFKTRSNIDKSYEKDGLFVDGRQVAEIDDIRNHTNLAIDQEYESVVASMLNGKNMRLALGFWPTWPVTQTYSIDYDISAFAPAYGALQRCLALEKGLK